MKVFLSGKITGKENYRESFYHVGAKIMSAGDTVLNPCMLPQGLEYEDYMHICRAMIDVSDVVYMLDDWRESPGAKREFHYALATGKKTIGAASRVTEP